MISSMDYTQYGQHRNEANMSYIINRQTLSRLFNSVHKLRNNKNGLRYFSGRDWIHGSTKRNASWPRATEQCLDVTPLEQQFPLSGEYCFSNIMRKRIPENGPPTRLTPEENATVKQTNVVSGIMVIFVVSYKPQKWSSSWHCKFWLMFCYIF